MHPYSGKYYCNETESDATFSLLKDKLCIEITGEEKAATIFWYFDGITKEEDSINTFRYHNYPPQKISIQSHTFTQELLQRLQRSGKRSSLIKLAPLLKILFWFTAFLLLAYFFLVPWVAASLANRFPIEQEKSIGTQAYNSIKSSFTIDEGKTALMNTFYKGLNFPSKYDVKITVVKSEIANAFAMPGGHIVVYDKILNGMTSYEQLAALLSHEFTHVEHRHSLRSLFRQLSSRIFLSLILGDASAVGAVLVDNADKLKSLSYSRSLETEADDNGALLLSQRRIDCSGFVQLFQLLQKESGSLQVSEWMSSHPDLNKRIENIRGNNNCAATTARKDSSLQHSFLQLKTSW